jgi:predicted permease
MTQRTPVEGLYRVRWSWPRFQMLSESVRSFEAVATSSNNVVTLTGVNDPEPVAIEVVSPEYLRVMGAALVAGTGFSRREVRDATPLHEVVLSHPVWDRRFGRASDVVGRTIALNGVTVTVAGVAEEGFAGVSGLARAWIPSTLAPLVTYDEYLTTNQNFITVIGRLQPDATMADANAELAVLGPQIHAAHPLELVTPDDRISAAAMSLRDARTDVVTRRALTLLGGGATILLLIACANVASLLLGRTASRRREIAMRLALGADRWRLVRQLLVESSVIAAAGGFAGVLAAGWAIRLIAIPPTLARGRNFYGAVGEFALPVLDARVLLFAILASATTVLVFGLLPALRAARPDLFVDLRGGVVASGSRRHLGLREMSVSLQVALAIVLTVGCGLLIASYARLRETPLGFDPSGVLTFAIRPSEVRYPTDAAPPLIERVLAEIGRVPGVESATVDGCVPLSMQCAVGTLQIAGRPWPGDPPPVRRHYVAPDHFRTLRIPIVRGRAFTDRDRAGQPRVVVINEEAQRRFWPADDPIGRRVWFDGAPNFGSAGEAAEIVGIVANTAYQPLDEQPTEPDFFTPFAQFTYATRMVMVRTAGDPLAQVPAIAAAVSRADADLALFDVETMDARASLSWSKRTFQTTLFGAIGSIALVLAIAGVYAVTSYFVTSRRREIGVRIALGADAVRIARTSVSQTARIGLIGGLGGLVASLGLTRLLETTLYATSAWDPIVYLVTLGVLSIALVAATFVPVRRAVKVNPIEVLRSE